MMVASPMGMVPKNIETVECPNPPRLVEEQHPARRVQQTEHYEQADVEQPQPFGEQSQPRKLHRQLAQGQGKNTGAHGRGEPVGSELSDHLSRMTQVAEGSASDNSIIGRDGLRASHGQLLCSGEVELIL